MTHTVDEVSDLLDVPRPTLYRYLREYSIPHLRRSGKIYVPEESFDRIKEVRELHKEGLGTESVHRRLRGESNFDIEGIEERLDLLLKVLEGLRDDLKPANERLPAQEALQAILARQDLLLTEVSSLAGTLKDLAPTNGRRQKAAPSDTEEKQRREVSFEQPEERFEPPENDPTVDMSLVATSPEPPTAPARSSTRRRRKFGVMARRRRRGALAILLLALLAGIALTVYTLNGQEGFKAPQGETSQQETTSAPPQEAAPSTTEEVPTGGPKTTPAPAAHDRREPTRPTEDGSGGSTPQQPFYEGQYQRQYATPGPLPQGQYAPSQYEPLGGPAIYAPAAQDPAIR